MLDYFTNADIVEKLGIPNTYRKNKSAEYIYWFRSLLQKIDSSLIFKGLPDHWHEDFFKFCLWARGFVVVFDTKRWGIMFNPSTSISGNGFFYEPTITSVANPLYQNTFTIGKDCELIKLTPDFLGIFDTIDKYATMLAELDKSIMMQFINAKIPMILAAHSKAESDLLKSVYDLVQSGESLIVYKNKLNDNQVIPRTEPFGFWNQDFKQTYIAVDLLQNKETILNEFYKEIGLPTNVSDKKAHTLNAEAGFEAAQSQARVASWVCNLNESFDRVERHFGLKLEVEYAQNDLTANVESTEPNESAD